MGSLPLAGDEAVPPTLGGQRAFACLLGASLWALPPALGFWGAAAGDGPASPRMGVGGYVALVGCGSLSLVLVALSWGSPARSERKAKWSRTLTLGLGLSLGPWAALAYALTVATHHRPLGAVTYAVGACIIGGLGLALARWMLRSGPSVRRRGPLGWALCAASAASLVFMVLRSAFQQPALHPVLPDAALGVLLALLVVVGPGLRGERRAAPWAVPMCVGVWVLTLGLLMSSAEVRATVKSAPVIAGVAGLALP